MTIENWEEHYKRHTPKYWEDNLYTVWGVESRSRIKYYKGSFRDVVRYCVVALEDFDAQGIFEVEIVEEVTPTKIREAKILREKLDDLRKEVSTLERRLYYNS